MKGSQLPNGAQFQKNRAITTLTLISLVCLVTSNGRDWGGRITYKYQVVRSLVVPIRLIFLKDFAHRWRNHFRSHLVLIDWQSEVRREKNSARKHHWNETQTRSPHAMFSKEAETTAWNSFFARYPLFKVLLTKVKNHTVRPWNLDSLWQHRLDHSFQTASIIMSFLLQKSTRENHSQSGGLSRLSLKSHINSNAVNGSIGGDNSRTFSFNRGGRNRSKQQISGNQIMLQAQKTAVTTDQRQKQQFQKQKPPKQQQQSAKQEQENFGDYTMDESKSSQRHDNKYWCW